MAGAAQGVPRWITLGRALSLSFAAALLLAGLAFSAANSLQLTGPYGSDPGQTLDAASTAGKSITNITQSRYSEVDRITHVAALRAGKAEENVTGGLHVRFEDARGHVEVAALPRHADEEGAESFQRLHKPAVVATRGSSEDVHAPSQKSSEKLTQEAWAQAKNAVEVASYLRITSTMCNLSQLAGGDRGGRQWRQDLRDALVEEVQAASEASYHAAAVKAPEPTLLKAAASGEALCSDSRWTEVFSGRAREQPAVVVDVLSGFQGGSEVGLLEIRLYEFSGLVELTVVGEGRHNHRGDIKHLTYPAFQNSLFKPFQDRILHVIMEEAASPSCLAYKKRLAELRARRGPRAQDEWPLQTAQRQCIWEELLKRRPDIPENAIILFSDLDEFPPRELVQALRTCELNTKHEWRPLLLKHKSIHYNLRSTARGNCNQVHKQGSINLKSFMSSGPRLGYPSSVVVEGGAHLSYYGSMPQILYKGINHAEGGGMLGTVMPNDEEIPPCKVNEGHAVSMADQLRDDPRWIVRHWERRHEKLPPFAPTQKDLSLCGVPHFLRKNAWRYPDFFGST
eukprot:TRINITY_DN28037_c0_g1_i1.p1 TRINITY_DN28037_c0_g1~~TRINITY_DN28037_c0_g1_i1.p1  ORF type:complete len:568 (+),score=93.57 TRINITY_DN28037_c0_g1_i1:114-1817(+)